MTDKPIRVLLVADARVFREFISRTLSMDFSIHVVDVLENPSNALSQIDKASPNILVLDVTNPALGYRDADRKSVV